MSLETTLKETCDGLKSNRVGERKKNGEILKDFLTRNAVPSLLSENTLNRRGYTWSEVFDDINDYVMKELEKYETSKTFDNVTGPLLASLLNLCVSGANKGGAYIKCEKIMDSCLLILKDSRLSKAVGDAYYTLLYRHILPCKYYLGFITPTTWDGMTYSVFKALQFHALYNMSEKNRLGCYATVSSIFIDEVVVSGLLWTSFLYIKHIYLLVYIYRPHERSSQLERIKVENLIEDDVKEEYNAKLKETFIGIDDITEVEELWNVFKMGVVNVASKVCGVSKRKKGTWVKNVWWDKDVQRLVNEKKKAWKDWLALRTVNGINKPDELSEARNRYKSLKQTVKQTIKKKIIKNIKMTEQTI